MTEALHKTVLPVFEEIIRQEGIFLSKKCERRNSSKDLRVQAIFDAGDGLKYWRNGSLNDTVRSSSSKTTKKEENNLLFSVSFDNGGSKIHTIPSYYIEFISQKIERGSRVEVEIKNNSWERGTIHTVTSSGESRNEEYDIIFDKNCTESGEGESTQIKSRRFNIRVIPNDVIPIGTRVDVVMEREGATNHSKNKDDNDDNKYSSEQENKELSAKSQRGIITKVNNQSKSGWTSYNIKVDKQRRELKDVKVSKLRCIDFLPSSVHQQMISDDVDASGCVDVNVFFEAFLEVNGVELEEAYEEVLLTQYPETKSNRNNRSSTVELINYNQFYKDFNIYLNDLYQKQVKSESSASDTAGERQVNNILQRLASTSTIVKDMQNAFEKKFREKKFCSKRDFIKVIDNYGGVSDKSEQEILLKKFQDGASKNRLRIVSINWFEMIQILEKFQVSNKASNHRKEDPSDNTNTDSRRNGNFNDDEDDLRDGIKRSARLNEDEQPLDTSHAMISPETKLLLNKFMKEAKKKKYKLKQKMKGADESKTDRLDSVTFMKYLTNSAAKLPDTGVLDDVVAVFSFPPDKSKVAYKSFLDYAQDSAPDIEEDIIAEKLRGLLTKIGRDVTTRDEKLFEIFQSMDENGNDILDEDEFRRGIRRLKIDLNDGEINLLLDMFDDDESGGIDYQEFIEFIYPVADMSEIQMKLQRVLSLLDDRGFDGERHLLQYASAGGVVSRVLLKRWIVELGVPLTHDEITVLIGEFDKQHSDKIKANQILDFAFGGSKSQQFNQFGGGIPGIMNAAEADDNMFSEEGAEERLSRTKKERKIAFLAGHVRNIIHEAAGNYTKNSSGMREKEDMLRKLFKKADRNGSKTLNLDELEGVLTSVGAELDSAELSDLFACFDVNQTGTVSYAEFINFMLDEPFSEAFEVFIEKVRQCLRHEVGKHRGSIQTLFEKFDQNKSGELDKREFKSAMSQLSIKMSEKEFKLLLDRFDQDGDGYVMYSEFAAFVEPSDDSDTVELKLRTILKACSRRGISPLSLFLSHDPKQTHYISAKMFRGVMRDYGFPLTNAELSAAIVRFDDQGNGTVNYKELIELSQTLVRKKTRFSEASPIYYDENSECDDDEIEDETYIRKLNAAILSVFEYFDEDNSGSIDIHEFGKACRAMGMDLDEKELQVVMDECDADKSGSISFQEFKAVIKFKMKEHQRLKLSSEDMHQLELAFKSFDRDGSGSCNVDELGLILFDILGIKLRRSEVESLIAVVDDEGDGEMEFDEFEQLIRLLQDDAAIDQLEPLARRTLKKILRGQVKDPKEYLTMFSEMPSNFRPAVCKSLDYRAEHSIQDALLPLPSIHGLHFHDMIPVDSAGLRTTLRPYDGNSNYLTNLDTKGVSKRKNKGRNARNNNDLHLMQAVLELKMGKGIPMPPDDMRNNIIARNVRVCFFDDPDGTSKDTFVGNQFLVNAAWQSVEEDVWRFDTRYDGTNNFLVRTDWPLQHCGNTGANHDCRSHFYVILELTVSLEIDGNIREMTCGWCTLSMKELSDLNTSKVFEKNLMGGTPSAPQDIVMDEVLQRRTGWRKMAKAFTGKNAPQIIIKASPIKSLGRDTQSHIRQLPHSLIINLGAIEVISRYRSILAEVMLQPVVPNMTRIFNPTLVLFPHILADNNVLHAFVVSWGNKKKEFTRAQRKDETYQKEIFNESVLRMWPAFCSHNKLLSSEPFIGAAGGNSTGMYEDQNASLAATNGLRNTASSSLSVDKTNVINRSRAQSLTNGNGGTSDTRIQTLMRLACRDPSKFFSPSPDDNVLFTPFNINEASFQAKPKAASIWGALEVIPASSVLNVATYNGSKHDKSVSDDEEDGSVYTDDDGVTYDD